MSNDCLRIWFCTDIHGSDACFDKFLKLLDIKKPTMRPNVMIIGGDITGKDLVLIKKKTITGGKRYEYIDYDGLVKNVSQERIDDELKFLSDGGKYPIVCTEKEYFNITNNPGVYDKHLNDERKKRVKKWVNALESKLKNNPDVQVYINCGNDDPLYVDQLLLGFQPEGRVITLKGNVKLLSLGYSNITPWKCPRDADEDVLRQKIAQMTAQTNKNDVLIFNFHCPPFNTSLDEVYEVDETFQKSSYKKHVGSSSIREAIESYKPLLSLHGHIHEVSNSDLLGQTRCVNPGSNYQNGILQGAYFIIDNGVIKNETIVKDLFPEKSNKTLTGLWGIIFKLLLKFINH